jgi:hypothetical protein
MFVLNRCVTCSSPPYKCPNKNIDTPYDQVKEAQEWWRTVELKDNHKELVGRENAIRLFKLPI